MRPSEHFALDARTMLARRMFEAGPLHPLLWTSQYGTDGARYGGYRHVGPDNLRGRTYEIELADSGISILWLDVMYDCATRQVRPVSKCPLTYPGNAGVSQPAATGPAAGPATPQARPKP